MTPDKSPLPLICNPTPSDRRHCTAPGESWCTLTPSSLSCCTRPTHPQTRIHTYIHTHRPTHTPPHSHRPPYTYIHTHTHTDTPTHPHLATPGQSADLLWTHPVVLFTRSCLFLPNVERPLCHRGLLPLGLTPSPPQPPSSRCFAVSVILPASPPATRPTGGVDDLRVSLLLLSLVCCRVGGDVHLTFLL